MSNPSGKRVMINPSTGQIEFWNGSYIPGTMGFGTTGAPFLMFYEVGKRTGIGLSPGILTLSDNSWDGKTLSFSASNIGHGSVYKDNNGFLKVR